MNDRKISQLLAISKSCEADVLKDLVRNFVSEAPKRIREIKGSIKSTDMIRLQKATHLLKSKSDYLGAEKLAEVTTDLEKCFRGGEIPENIEIIINELEYLFNDARDCLYKKIGSK